MRNIVLFGDDLYMELGKTIRYGTPDCKMGHMHSGYEFLLIPDEISYNMMLNGAVFSGTGPIAFLIAPYSSHFTYYTNTWSTGRFFAFYLGADYLEQIKAFGVDVKEKLQKGGAKSFTLQEKKETMEQLLSLVTNEHQRQKKVQGRTYRETNVNQKLIVAALLNMIINVEEGQPLEKMQKREYYIPDVMQYIVSNLDKKINTPEIAEVFFVSRDKLNRDFKKHSGMTIKEFVMESRINLAKSKLCEGKCKVEEISELCGFEDKRSFYYFFKHTVGMTPREYAKKYH